MNGRKRFNPARNQGRPYNFFGDYLWEKYQCRVLKLPVSAGLTCPNRDGTLSDSGCLFCSDEGSASPTCASARDILTQMQSARDSFRRSSAETRYIAYFQAFTNTYAPASRLKELYDLAVTFPDIIGMMIGTRPDCLPDDVLDLIASYAGENFELWLEVGVQTVHDRSLALLNRGHDHAASRDALLRAAARRIPLCAHLILGIPGESWQDMMSTAEEISRLPVAGVKIHHLHVIKGTALESLYRRGQIAPLSFRTYISTLCDFLERLRPDILIHRLMGDRAADTLAAPRWGLHKGTVLKAIEDEFRSRETWQGFLFQPEAENTD